MKPEFRVWDKDLKKYSESSGLISTSGEYYDGLLGIMDDDPQNCQFVLEQYTGLKDKNGHKIFEGDILKMHSHVVLYGSDLNKWVDDYSPITWDKSMGAFTYQGELLAYQLYAGTQQDGIYHDALELVGNIYENPELLEVEK